MLRALLVGQDEMLQFTRAALLRSLGVETVCCQGTDALDIQRDRRCDLIVLCHSLPAQLSSSLAREIHLSWPNTQILRVVLRDWEMVDSAVAGVTVSSADPASLMRKARKLLHVDPGVTRTQRMEHKPFC